MLVDSGSSINLLKKSFVPNDAKQESQTKQFKMGNETHTSDFKIELQYLDINHVFHIVPDDFPVPEDGIMGLCFLQQYNYMFLMLI